VTYGKKSYIPIEHGKFAGPLGQEGKRSGMGRGTRKTNPSYGHKKMGGAETRIDVRCADDFITLDAAIQEGCEEIAKSRNLVKKSGKKRKLSQNQPKKEKESGGRKIWLSVVSVQVGGGHSAWGRCVKKSKDLAKTGETRQLSSWHSK